MDLSATASVIVAATSSVGKTFLIGAVGYAAVKYPKENPLLPIDSINMLSRLTFNILLVPLYYTGIASSVTLESITSLWYVLLGAMSVIAISYIVTSITGRLFCLDNSKSEFKALVIATAFPNIIALPILIFPTLCEYEVVHDNFSGIIAEALIEFSTEDKISLCVAESNAIIFTYFFGYSIVFWSFANHALVNLPNEEKREDNISKDNTQHCAFENLDCEEDQLQHPARRDSLGDRKDKTTEEHLSLNLACEEDQLQYPKRSDSIGDGEDKTTEQHLTLKDRVIQTIKDVICSPGFVALVLGFVTACIIPLQNALFNPGGSLRFIGSALEALTQSAVTFANIIVAASLAEFTERSDRKPDEETLTRQTTKESIMANFACTSEMRKESLRRNMWHLIARLFVTPGVVCIVLVVLDCGNFISSVSPMCKLVLLVNSSVPGALMVVVILKTEGLSKTASYVSHAYLPSYLLSIVTIATWTTIGLLLFSKQDGGSCGI